ncbi:MAG TPA: ABC transporter ATP-binding protein [Burkholderiaceae bacterium]|nr:ABC transporter ATP-binding protein [Burkholderiaceae bacterium]
MTPPIIEVDQLVFDYPGHRALHGVSFAIERGSVTALVGPNGAGKTTLMRLIAALDTPFAGTVRVQGVDVQEAPRAVHRHIGYLADQFGLYGSLSVRRCLAFAAASQGLASDEIDAAVQDTARLLDLEDKLDAQAGRLSRGQRQRVAIGQAIIHRPAVVLLDEPASGLDPEARNALAGVFRQMQAAGMTLLVSSHILAELDAYSTHMLALREGRIQDLRALHGASDSLVRRLRLHWRGAAEDALAALRAQPGVHVLHSETRQAEFELDGDDDAQAQLLERLVQAQRAAASGRFAVIGLEAVRENLQDSYLRSMQGSAAPAASDGGRA